MQGWLKTLIAAYGAKKLGGGCLSTILIFIIIYYALGQCNPPAIQHIRVNSEQHIKTAGLVIPGDLYIITPGINNKKEK